MHPASGPLSPLRRARGLAVPLCAAAALAALAGLAFLPSPSAAAAPRAAGGRRAIVAAPAAAAALTLSGSEANAALSSSIQGASPEDAKLDWKRLYPIQFIAALGDPESATGTGAEQWGIWTKDPGPRGVTLSQIDRVRTVKKGETPYGWKFDDADWYVEEHGLIMEKPRGGDGGSGELIKPGKYIVTGDRQVTTVLTVSPPDATGAMKWTLGAGKLFDVTHLPCRTGRYTGAGCSPAAARQSDFPVKPGALMPEVPGCNKVDYAVLFVLGVAA